MINFAGVITAPYIGNLFTQPVTSKKNPFGGSPSPLPPTCVVTQFFWSNYGASTTQPNVAASVNLQALGNQVLIDRIVSVRIDNLGNAVPVFVYFPDTAYTLVCPPNATVWEKVETNGFLALVVGEGFTTNTVGATSVYFYNREAPPFLNNAFPQSADLWLASSQITRGTSIYNTNFGVPALGDQTINYNNAANIGVLQNNLWGTPYQSGFIYLTHVDISLQPTLASPGNEAAFNWVVESTGTAGTLYSFQFAFLQPAGSSLNTSGQIAKMLNFSAMNIKLDATQTWRIRGTSIQFLNALLNSTFNFTTNPN